MDLYDKLRLMAQHMRYHEHLATLSPRGSITRMVHEEAAQQYRDQILGNAKSGNVNIINTVMEK